MQEGHQSTDTPWAYKPEDQARDEAAVDEALGIVTQDEAQESTSPDDYAISWTSSEYLSHEKGSNWFFLVGGSAVGLAGLVFLISRDLISTALTFVIVIAFGVFGARKPRTLEYKVDMHGIEVGGKFRPYEDFKSFTIIQEGAFLSVEMMPVKRLMPPLTLYFPPEEAPSIIEAIAQYLPHDQRQISWIDELMRHIRF